MAYADDVIDVAQCEFEELVCQDTCGVCEAKERMIGEDSPQTHRSCVQYSFVAEAAQACVAVHNLDTFPNDDVAKDGEEREDGRKGAFPINDRKGNMVDLEPICQIADSSATFVGMSDYYDFVATVDEFGRELIDVTFDSARLGKEEVTNHSNIVRHLARCFFFRTSCESLIANIFLSS